MNKNFDVIFFNDDVVISKKDDIIFFIKNNNKKLSINQSSVYSIIYKQSILYIYDTYQPDPLTISDLFLNDEEFYDIVIGIMC